MIVHRRLVHEAQAISLAGLEQSCSVGPDALSVDEELPMFLIFTSYAASLSDRALLRLETHPISVLRASKATLGSAMPW
jgi:hypothetical protein